MTKTDKALLGRRMWYAKSHRDAETSTTGLTALWHDPNAKPDELLADVSWHMQPDYQYLKLEEWQAYKRAKPRRGTGVRAVIVREYVREGDTWRLVSGEVRP